MPKQQWSKDECRDRYVRGAKIGLRELSHLSGRALSVLAKWSQQENWTSQREQYQNNLRSQTDQQAIAKTADKLSDQLSEMAIEHYHSYRGGRRIADFLLQRMTAKIEALESSHPEMREPEALRESLQSLIKDSNPAVLNQLTQAIDRCVKGERTVLGLEYEDLNKAIAAVEKAGLEVRIPPNVTFIQDISQLQPNSSTNSVLPRP
jgi:hypothetical protein